tara:strand:- start:20 stop:373 length:354 start_codon:yes stop_codon:yes gene_type:complete
MDTDKMVSVCGHRVLLDVHFDSETIEDGALQGFQLESESQRKMSMAAAVTGRVVAIGPMAWHVFDKADPDWAPWCKVEDIVYFAKYAAKYITIKGKSYVIVNDEDIQAVILPEGEEV